MSSSDPLRVLIVKLTAIGDVLHAMPVACALRDHRPDVRVGWLVEGRAGDLLEGHDAVDDLIVAPRRWLKSRAQIRAMRDRLRAIGYDVSIDLQGLTKSAYAARLSGARRRIGFGGNLFLDIGRWLNNDLFYRTIGREASRWINNERVIPRAAHIVDRYLETLAPLGIDAPSVRFGVPRFEPESEHMDRALRGVPRRFAVISPGAGHPSKLWCTERFADVAAHLGRAHHLSTVIAWAGDREKAWAEQIVKRAGSHARLAPPTTLRELAELTRRATLFIAPDTGPLQLAAAVGVPCVGLFAILPASRNGPYGPHHMAIQRRQRTGTSVQRHREHNAEMLAIGVEDVCAACQQVLASSGRMDAPTVSVADPVTPAPSLVTAPGRS